MWSLNRHDRMLSAVGAGPASYPACRRGPGRPRTECNIIETPATLARSRRVRLLVAGIIVLSLADLLITLAYLRINWMMEANPIAAYLIQATDSAWALSSFKALSVGICALVLWRLRRHVAGELAAWASVAILTVMSVMWHRYAAHFDETHPVILAQVGMADDYRLGLP